MHRGRRSFHFISAPFISFMHSCLQLISFSDRFIQSFTHSFTHSFIHAFVHSFIHSIIQSFIHSNIPTFKHSIIQSCIHSFNLLFLFHSFFPFRFFLCDSLPSFQSFSFYFILFAPRSCTQCCFHAAFCHFISCHVKSVRGNPFTILHLTNVSYKQPISYSHDPFSKLPPRHVQDTTWYIYIYLFIIYFPSVYIYINIHIYICIYMYIYIYVYIYSFVYTQVYIK